MRHIHITLVGKETVPVVSLLKYITPDQTILICSDDTLKQANEIRNHSAFSTLSFDLKVMKPHDLLAIENDIDKIAESIEDEDVVSLNLVGGTKFWALAFYRRFANRPYTHVFLVGQDNVLWNLNQNVQDRIEPLGLDTIFTLQGQKVKSYKNISEYTEEDDIALAAIEKARSLSYTAFKNLTATLSTEGKKMLRKQDTGYFKDSEGNKVNWDKTNHTVEILYKDKEPIAISSPNIIDLTFNSGWFEYKVAKMIEGWDKAKSIRVNSVFTTKNGNDKNEVDIIIETDVKPIFIECKTQIFNSTDLDKFATVVRNYGSKACSAVFITEAPAKKDTIGSKCKDSNIAHFCLQANQHDLQNKLYSFLDKVMSKINA